jgi:hypothetical protein
MDEQEKMKEDLRQKLDKMLPVQEEMNSKLLFDPEQDKKINS